MKRFVTASVVSIGMMLATAAGVASAGIVPLPPPPPAPTQSNDSDQHQVQIVPIAPQLNAQNVNVLSSGVSQGDANNANTGQATQQDGGQASQPDVFTTQTTSKTKDVGPSQAGTSGGNDSDQSQVQVVPIAPQINVQNVNVAGTFVDQGNANNANTGQAAQQDGATSSPDVILPFSGKEKGAGGGKSNGGNSQPAGNDSDQHQVQVVPIAPQLNAQNVNVLSDDVSQGNANNANTGQATQQNGAEQAPLYVISPNGKAKGGGGKSNGGGNSQPAQNNSDQHQVQIIPVAPQLNLQNINVESNGVSQGDANNANTGQATQQNGGGQQAPLPPVIYGATSRINGPSQGGSGSKSNGGNDSDQHQLQFVPIAPQLNLQNVNVEFDGVSQGNANNANTGQAVQQEGNGSGAPGGNGPAPCLDRCGPPAPCLDQCQPEPTPCLNQCEPTPCLDQCDPRPEPKPCRPKQEPKPCPPKHEQKPCPPKDEAKPCPPKHETKPCPPKHETKPCPPKHETKPCPPKEEPNPCPPTRPERQQGNDSNQCQVQIVPIAPQLNIQNVNVLSNGVSQGNANNANTGQATQQNGASQPVLLPTGGGLPTIV